MRCEGLVGYTGSSQGGQWLRLVQTVGSVIEHLGQTGGWLPAGLLWQPEAPKSPIGCDQTEKVLLFFKLFFLNTLFYTVVGTFFMLKSALSSSVKGIPCLFMELVCQNKGTDTVHPKPVQLDVNSHGFNFLCSLMSR